MNTNTTAPSGVVSSAELGYFKLRITCRICGLVDIADRDNEDPKAAIEMRSTCTACGGGFDSEIEYLDSDGNAIEQPNT